MIEVSETRINYLKQWRIERNLEREIARNCVSDGIGETLGAGGDEHLGSAAKEFDSEIHAGDIRLLSDNLTTHAMAPRYVAVLTPPRGGIVVCAPFSCYSTPATKDEWLTGLKSPSLRVLQLWNAQPCAVRSVAQSWKVLSFDERRLSRAVKLYKHSVGHTFPEDDDREDIGVAIVSKHDERNDYMADEYAEFAPLFSSAMRVVKFLDVIAELSLPMVFGRRECAMAAADERRNPFAKGVLEGTEVAVSAEYETDKKILRIKLRKVDKTYDGWTVWTANAVELDEIGTIENGMCVVGNVEVAILEKGLVFVSPDGETIKQFVPSGTV